MDEKSQPAVDRPTITPAQCRASRAILNLSQTELARVAGVSRSMLHDFEREMRKSTQRSTRTAIQLALEAMGVDLKPPVEGRAGLYFIEGWKPGDLESAAPE